MAAADEPPVRLEPDREDDEPDDAELAVTVLRRGRAGRRRASWDRTPPGGPGLGDSVCFEHNGREVWGLLADRLADGTLRLSVKSKKATGRFEIAPDQVKQWEAGRERSGIPLPENAGR